MFAVVLHYVWLVLQVVVCLHLVLPLCLYLTYGVSKLAKRKLPPNESLAEEKDYAIIVSVYGSGQALQPLVNSLLQLRYSNYLIYVVMNDCGMGHLSINHEKVILLHPMQPFTDCLRLNRFVVESFRRPHTHLTILDSRSLANVEYLNGLNAFFNKGYQAVQGMCVTKPNGNVYNSIHAAGNNYNSFFGRYISFSLGSSASLAGCGMAFTISLYKHCLKQLQPGNINFTKALQYVIINKGHQIVFAPKAIVHDQRTMQLPSLLKQHARCANTWMKQLTNNIRIFYKGISHINVNQFLFGVLALQLPPFTSLVWAVFFLVINIWISPAAALIFTIALCIFVLCFLISAWHVTSFRSSRNIVKQYEHYSFSNVLSFYKKVKEKIYTATPASFIANE